MRSDIFQILVSKNLPYPNGRQFRIMRTNLALYLYPYLIHTRSYRYHNCEPITPESENRNTANLMKRADEYYRGSLSRKNRVLPKDRTLIQSTNLMNKQHKQLYKWLLMNVWRGLRPCLFLEEQNEFVSSLVLIIYHNNRLQRLNIVIHACRMFKLTIC